MRCVGTPRPGHPVPAKGNRPHPLQGRGPPGGPQTSARFLPRPPAAGLAGVSIARLAARARGCVCLHTPRRALAQAQNLSPKPEGGGGRRRGPASVPWAGASRPAGSPISAPARLQRVPFSGQPPPLSVAGCALLFNHSYPQSWLRRAAGPFPPTGNVAGNSEWHSPPPHPQRPPRRQPCSGGRGGSWETKAVSPGTLAAPPGASARPARPPLPGPQRPSRAPRQRPLARLGRRPEPPPRRPSTPAPLPGSQSRLEEGRRPPARPRFARPSSLARSAPSIPLPPRAPGLSEPVLTRSRGWTAQPGPLPALPPRARRGCTSQAPGRDAPVLPGALGPRHPLAREGRCGEERGGEAPAPSPKRRHRALPQGPRPKLCGGKRCEVPPLKSQKGKFEKTCPVHVDSQLENTLEGA